MKYFRLFFLSCIFSSRCLGADITIESYREDLRFVLPDKVKKRKKIEHSDFTHLYQSLWDTIDYIQEKTDKIPFFLPRYFQAVAKDLGKKREFEKTRCGKDIEGDAVDNLILLTCFMEAKSFLEKNELMPKELGQKMAKASKDINAFVLKNTMAKNKKKDCDSCKGERELIDFSQVNFSKYSGGDEEIDKMAKEVVMALYQHQPDSLFSPESFQKLLSCLKEIKSSGEQQVICPSGLKKRKYLQDIPVQFDKTPEFVAIYKENGFNHILNFKPREVYPFSPTRSFSLHSTVITPRNKSVLEREIYLLQKISQMPLAQKRNIQQIVRKPHVESGRLSYIGEPFAVRSSYEKDLLSSKEIKHFVHGCFEGLYNLMSLGIYYTNFLVEEDRVIGITKEKNCVLTDLGNTITIEGEVEMNSEFQIFDSPEIESLKRKAAKEEKKTITLTEEQMKADNTFQMAMKLLHEVYRKIGGLEYFKECAYKVRFGEVSSYSECATNKIREAVKKEKDLKRDKMIQILLKAVDPDPRKRIDIEKILKSTE